MTADPTQPLQGDACAESIGDLIIFSRKLIVCLSLCHLVPDLYVLLQQFELIVFYNVSENQTFFAIMLPHICHSAS